jgi:hypothetical protein
MHNTTMNCANCGSERLDSFCGHCGQNDRDYQRALPPLLGDLLRETFEIDSRLYRTIGKLLFHPGELAVEFSRNRRASYVSPIRLYLFVSILFFFLLSLNTDLENANRIEPAEVTREAGSVGEVDTTNMQGVLGEVRRQKVTEILARPETSIARLVVLELARGMEESPREQDAAEIFLLGQMIDALYEPGTALDQLMDNLPIAMFIMLPIYALLLKLFYYRKHRFYVENLVFATHLHTFAFLVFTAQLLMPNQTSYEWLQGLFDTLSGLFMIALAVYHFLALKRYFEDGNLVTLVKFCFLMLLYLSILMPTAFIAVLFVTLVTV